MSQSRSSTSHRFWMVKYVLWMVAIGVVVLFFVLPLVTTYVLRSGYPFQSMAKWLNAIQWMQTVVMHGFVYVWITFVGSCFASFLNVVAWRVPRGRSILGSSHCPHCDCRLSIKDNVPIFGWLNNDGKCRNCHAPIAVRYLVVELLLGVAFLLLFLLGVVGGGVNLPLRPDLYRVGIEFVLFTPNWFLILTFIYHAVLMCGLFTVAVVASERKPVPGSIVLFASVFVVAIASTWPHVIQVPWTAGIAPVLDWPPQAFSQTSLLTMVLGMAAGGVLGVLWFAAVKLKSKIGGTNDLSFGTAFIDLRSVVASMALVGLALGWQSAVWVLVISVGLGWGLGWWMGRLLGTDEGHGNTASNSTLTALSTPTPPPTEVSIRCRLRSVAGNASAVVMFATIVHILFWRWQMPVQFWLTTLNEG